MARKICKSCHHIYEGERCPLCKSDATASSAKGRVYIFDPEKSEVSKKMGIGIKGEYAIKI